MGGKVRVSHHANLDIFDNLIGKIKFFILPGLQTFDGIIGNDTLRQLGAVIHTDKNFFTLKNQLKFPLFQLESQAVNKLDIRIDHLSQDQNVRLCKILRSCPTLFSTPDIKLTFTTNVKGEIRTTTDEPIYTRSYPYPMALKAEMDKQITELLNDGIIRPSKSPYNSPVWIVNKKEDASGMQKYRMVIDYRKLNTITIADRYPIPEVNEVLYNLGRNKFFTILDLKSGFHQIALKEADMEKTAFSVNNGKYEFTRLPFGLKNAPSIFQRALDDVLRQHIGIRCYVYIDDIIIFGSSEEEHFQNLQMVLRTLEEAHFKVQLDKCEFLKREVEFLGFIVSQEGLKTNYKKVDAIFALPMPKTLKDVRSFLGMSGYYRRFIKDYAKIAKPLTSLLRGENGRLSKNISKTKLIDMNADAVNAWNQIKNCLVSDDIMLTYPDFKKTFELTTDASNYSLGAVLSQDGKPIMYLSRSLSKTEESYATNEKEMLAIIWALNSLRSFLYGSRKVKIYTDHQPLTYALSNKNSNSKMKRWKAILEEYNHELVYMPGRANVVADALSRPPLTQNYSLTPTEHSAESSAENLIECVGVPINVYRNQFLLTIGDTSTYQFKIIFSGYHRHIIEEPEYTREKLLELLKRYLNPSVINCIKTDERTMGKIQEIYPTHFQNYKIRFTQIQVVDITSEQDQETIIIETHNRAHRNPKENRQQILEKYYFPGMAGKIQRISKLCAVCKENKYERHPNQPELNETPLPTYPGHTIHIDIFSTEKKFILTTLDKFTKYAQTKILRGKSTEDIRRPLRELLFFFGVPKSVVIDNERSLNSATILFMMRDELKINVYTTPPYRSEANGQVERFHSTMTEIMRCIKEDQTHRNFEELLERAVNEYNHSIHSVTGKKPVDLFFGRNVDFGPDDYEVTRQTTYQKLANKQKQDINQHNQKRQPIKNYLPGQVIYVRQNKRLGTKLTKRFREEIVKEDRNTTVLTESDKIIHKAHIRN